MADDNGSAAAATGGETNSEQTTQADNFLDASVAKQPADGAAAKVEGAADPAKPAAVDGFLNGKYKTKDEFEKGYNELRKSENDLRSKLKAYAGAPEKYELSMPEDLKERVEWRSGDPMLGEFQTMCKEAGVTQDFFTKCIHMLAKYEYANVNPDFKKDKAALGERADDRLKDFNDWYGANLDEAGTLLVKRALGVNPAPSDIFMALEAVSQAARQPAIHNVDDSVSSAPSLAEVDAMWNKTNDKGQRLVDIDPAYRNEVRAKRRAVVGEGDHKVIVGGARKAS